MKLSLITIMLALFCISFSAIASDNPPQPPDGSTPPAPPKEAITACANLTEGTACSFKGMRGENFTGVCKLMNSTLSCMPSGMPPKRPDSNQ
ncbi:hypothetical protein [Seleniivibrio sp.]|uniref:hypothetical protein n=1 Tax=Seleniivibrio sp. TaxID=2898801 RepID=UPI0025F136A8|nr:hypothetical protein [Seleniivibrio sp.]MCD8553622.1 hypothetical protein [Seleniivibrio sp.]